MTDDLNFVDTEKEFKLVQTPKYKWEWTHSEFNQFLVRGTSAPCWFHRLMQRLILGIKWRRIEK